MKYLTDKKYSFISNAPSLSDETFAVVKFKGVSAISQPYEFDILIISDNPEIDLSEIMRYSAKLTFHRGSGEDVFFNGVISKFEQLQKIGEFYLYRAVLVPRLWWLQLTQNNKILLKNNVKEIIESALKDGGLTSLDYDFSTAQNFISNEYVCQFAESNFNFFSRWAEREGFYYYFEQTENNEKIIFTDTKISHVDLPYSNNLSFAPLTSSDEIIHAFICQQRLLPAKIILKDYNYNNPSLEIIGSADIDENGRGEVFIYGENFLTIEEGNRLASIRAQEILCRKLQFTGESTIPFMEPGYTFNLTNHYRNSFNQKYLITEVTHEGNQAGYLISGIRSELSETESEAFYRNSFTAIPSTVQYRPDRKTQKPTISGTLNALIDAEGKGDFAEIDDEGRYKIRLPFDTEELHKDGKASSPVRMMQPYTGSNYGVHFPLHKGVEVQLSFVNGDIDRPVISGAIPNLNTQSPVTDKNNTKSVFRDNYGNEIVFDATPGDEHVRIHSPHHNSTIELGRSLVSKTENESWEWKGGNTAEFGAGNKFSAFAGNSAELKAGMSLSAMFGLSNEIQVVGKQAALIGYDAGFRWGPEFKLTFGPTIEKTDADKTSLAEEDNIVSAKQITSIVGGAGNKESTSIINLKDQKITLSVGSNKDPDKTVASMKEIKASLIATPVIMTIFATILGAFMAGTLETPEEAKDVRSTLSSVFGAAEGAALLLNIIIVLYLGYQLKENIKAVSHFDDDNDKVESIIELSKTQGILMGVWKSNAVSSSGVAPNFSPNKDTMTSILDMKKNGNIVIKSNPDTEADKKIVIGVGDVDAAADQQNARIRLQKEGTNIDIQSGKSQIWINKNGSISIDNEGATEGQKQIQILAEKDVYISGQTGDITLKARTVSATNGKFKTKNILDLG